MQLKTTHDCFKALMSHSFRYFFIANFKYQYNREPIIRYGHPEIISELETIANNKHDYDFLIIRIAPGTGKTTLVQHFVAWNFCRNPNMACIYATHSANITIKFSEEIKNIVINDLNKQYFPNTKIRKRTRAKKAWGLENADNDRSLFYSVSMSSATQGLDAGSTDSSRCSGFLIIDDPSDADDARNIKALHETYRQVTDKFLSRRRNTKTCTIIIGQALNQEDVAGLLMKDPEYNRRPNQIKVISIPAFNEETQTTNYPNTNPDLTTEGLLAMKESNEFKFNAQYQQNPSIASGEVIKKEWFQWYKLNSDKWFSWVFLTSDTASKIARHNDFSAICLWGVDARGIYLIEMWHGKWDGDQLYNMMHVAWKFACESAQLYCTDNAVSLLPRIFAIEDASSGIAMIQKLQKETKMPVMPISRQGKGSDKLTRAEGVLHYIASGKVFLPHDRQDITGKLLAECGSFSRDNTHVHDDIVDNILDAIIIGVQGWKGHIKPK